MLKKMEIKNIKIENPTHGIQIYKNAILNGTDIVDRLESVLANSSDELFKWSDSTNLLGKDLSNYRSCFDLKMHSDYWQFLTPEFEEIKNCYEEIDRGFLSAITHYKNLYNLKLPFQQGLNFIKYDKGHHFVTHVDAGSSYSSVVSAIAYLNDDYEGGELGFPLLDFQFKPEAGDIVMFPSSFMHAHKVNMVKSGCRYVATTFWDYTDKFHPKIKPSRKGIPKIYNNDNDWVEGEGFLFN
jgi:hypothetical protein